MKIKKTIDIQMARASTKEEMDAQLDELRTVQDQFQAANARLGQLARYDSGSERHTQQAKHVSQLQARIDQLTGVISREQKLLVEAEKNKIQVKQDLETQLVGTCQAILRLTDMDLIITQLSELAMQLSVLKEMDGLSAELFTELLNQIPTRIQLVCLHHTCPVDKLDIVQTTWSDISELVPGIDTFEVDVDMDDSDDAQMAIALERQERDAQMARQLDSDAERRQQEESDAQMARDLERMGGAKRHSSKKRHSHKKRHSRKKRHSSKK